MDDRLREQIDEAGDEGEVEAVLLFNVAEGNGGSEDPTPWEDVVGRVVEEIKEQPSHARYMSRLGVGVVRGTGRFIRQLIDQDEVVAASSADAEVVVPESGNQQEEGTTGQS